MIVIQNSYVGTRLPDQLKQKLQDYSISNNLRMSQVIRDAVVEYLRSTHVTSINPPRDNGWLIQR